MSDTITLNISFPTDDHGMIGRECPHCEKYFKVKPGTGLDVSTCICPYCEYKGDNSEFFTQAQLDYVQSLALREVLEPAFKYLQQGFKNLEHKTRGSFISFKVKTSGFELPIKYYTEKDLETIVECDSCGLLFAIYGDFASCPDCARLTAMSMFMKSIEVTRKRLVILSKIPSQEVELRTALLADTVSAAVATFDSLGKRMQDEFATILPEKPRNLFQNLDTLSKILQQNAMIDLPMLIGQGKYAKIYYMFQVRHVWTHNFGEADEDFIRKTKSDSNLVGKMVVLSQTDVEEFLILIENFGLALRDKIKNFASQAHTTDLLPPGSSTMP